MLEPHVLPCRCKVVVSPSFLIFISKQVWTPELLVPPFNNSLTPFKWHASGEGWGYTDSASVRICDPNQDLIMSYSYEEMRGPPHLCSCKSMSPDTVIAPSVPRNMYNCILFHTETILFRKDCRSPLYPSFLSPRFQLPMVNHSLQILNENSRNKRLLSLNRRLSKQHA